MYFACHTSTCTVLALVSRPGGLADMCAQVVGSGFPINFFIFERGWLIHNSVKVYRGGLQEGGGLQERIR